mmetsp:Transcript_8897/g.15421  ORF Transcript_8897/g.15421 Transcript_8897/m.15421 type:complete len:646 (-) Transcript_8897:521-2458(-)
MAGYGMNGTGRRIAEGQLTHTVYSLIKDNKHNEAIAHLDVERQNSPENRAALSLLGYCHYQAGHFESATHMYEQLTKLYPDNQEYKLYYAQSLHKKGVYSEASKAAGRVEGHGKAVTVLLVDISYEQDDLVGCRRQLERCPPEDPDTMVNLGCVLYKEGQYEAARQKFTDAMSVLGSKPELLYNTALCHYKSKQHTAALKHLADIIERGVREHPELSVGSNSDNMEVRSVGNSQVLKETALIEAFNLKAAIEYMRKSILDAKEALTDMPPRSEEELDSVTLHNVALLNMDTDPSGGFQRFGHLIENAPFPPETFGNLLLLYCKHSLYSVAADVMANNPDGVARFLPPDVYDFLQATVLREKSPHEAYDQYDKLVQRHTERLRSLTTDIAAAQGKRDNEAIKRAIVQYDEALEAYLPGLMAMAGIFFELENYTACERIFKQSSEFCKDHDTWKLNVAHTFFMRDIYKDAIRYYEPIVANNKDNLLETSAMLLANLCVSYIMTSQNEEAEELMRSVEKEEERSAGISEKQCLHLCIINLVIGTLYCAKGNYEFGISRIMKSLEPYNKKLDKDTWFYAKRCFLALIEGLAKQMLVLKDSSFQEMMAFLDEIEKVGKDVLATAGDSKHEARTVSAEARILKRCFLRMRD